jgi:hypothetical protein
MLMSTPAQCVFLKKSKSNSGNQILETLPGMITDLHNRRGNYNRHLHDLNNEQENLQKRSNGNLYLKKGQE